MYCTLEDLRSLLPDNIKIGDNNLGRPSPGRPQQTDNSNVSPDEAIRFIRFAQQEIDSRLRPYYTCPLRRIKSFETDILNNVSAGTNVNVRVWNTSNMAKGDSIRVQGFQNLEETTIVEIPNNTTVTLGQIQRNYDIESGKISVIEFPDPIPLITARLAVSYVFDEIFIAEQAPDVSNYSKNQRELAHNALDSILGGISVLQGQERTGRRFVRGQLFDSYDSPAKDFQFGREKA